MFAWSRDWTTLLPLRRTLSAPIFHSIDFWSSLSCIVLDIELADENITKEFGVFIDGKVQGYLFCPPKKYKPPKQAFCCTRNLRGIVCNSWRLDYNYLSDILLRGVKGEHFAKGLQKCKLLGNFLDEEVEKLEDNSCPKIQDLLDEEIWIRSSYIFRRKNKLHCAKRKAKLLRNGIMRHLML